MKKAESLNAKVDADREFRTKLMQMGVRLSHIQSFPDHNLKIP